MDPLEEPLPEFIELPTNQVHNKHSETSVLDAVYTFDMKIAQVRGLTFYPTRFLSQKIGDSIFRYNTTASHTSYTYKQFECNR